MVARLRYLGRLARLQPPTLLAILHINRDGKRIPWMQQIAGDCDLLASMDHVKPMRLGSLFDDHASWLELWKTKASGTAWWGTFHLLIIVLIVLLTLPRLMCTRPMPSFSRALIAEPGFLRHEQWKAT